VFGEITTRQFNTPLHW